MRSRALRKEHPRDLEGGRLSTHRVMRMQGVWASPAPAASDASPGVRCEGVWLGSPDTYWADTLALPESRCRASTGVDDCVSSKGGTSVLTDDAPAPVRTRKRRCPVGIRLRDGSIQVVRVSRVKPAEDTRLLCEVRRVGGSHRISLGWREPRCGRGGSPVRRAPARSRPGTRACGRLAQRCSNAYRRGGRARCRRTVARAWP